MEYIYYKDSKGNFGDDLNAWLWPKFFGEARPDGDAFVGIGSILANDSPLFKNLSGKRKIVFGTGIRPGWAPFAYDSSWDIKFLRGPLSSYAFNNQYEHIADAAYALGLISDFNAYRDVEKKYEISVIPYFKSLAYFDWEQICKQLGYHYISPSAEHGIEQTLREIAASKFVIAEAMHGAIISDILRVPWSRFVLTTPITEGLKVSEFKWMDWLYSIDLPATETAFIKLYRKSSVHQWIRKMSGNIVHADFLVKKVVKDELLRTLSSIDNYYLSKDEVIERINSRISEKIYQLKQEKGIYHHNNAIQY